MSQVDSTRLTTFETDDDETLVVLAGQSERDSRTIYQGASSGRYAIVPVDDLDDATDQELEADLDLASMEIVGETVTVPETGARDVALTTAEGQKMRMDREGVYGLLWVRTED